MEENMTYTRGPHRGSADTNTPPDRPPSSPQKVGSLGSILQEAINKSKGK